MVFLKRYKTLLTALILVVITLIMLSYSLKQPSEGIIRKLIIEISSSLEFGINASLSGIHQLWKRYIFLVGLEDENRRLKEQNAQLLSELIRYREGYLEADRLKTILNLQKNISYPAIGAQVIDTSQNSMFKTIMINRGTTHGLKNGMPVIASKGIVGRIVEISWHASRVLLIIDANSNIDVLIQRTRTQAILQGAGMRECSLKYILKSEDIRKGDVVISSGLGGTFPKEIMLGVVTSVDKSRSGLFQQIDVSPTVDFRKLEEVLVLLNVNKK